MIRLETAEELVISRDVVIDALGQQPFLVVVHAGGSSQHSTRVRRAETCYCRKSGAAATIRIKRRRTCLTKHWRTLIQIHQACVVCRFRGLMGRNVGKDRSAETRSR